MVGEHTARWESLERWSPPLFLVAGGLLVVHAGHHGLEAFTGFTWPVEHDFPFGVAGFIVGYVALLGLYPKFADRSPNLARAGTVFAVAGLIGWSALGVIGILELARGSHPAWLEPFAILNIVAIVMGYLCFGVAGLRTDVLSRTTSLVLLTPILAMILNVVIAIPLGGEGTGVGGFVVSSGFALVHLAIGGTLRSDLGPADRSDRTPGAIAGQD